MNYQQRLFDNYTVSHERGTLSSFSIEDDDVTHFRADEVVVLVVTATISGASYKHDTSGDWVRTNKLTSHEVRVASGVMKDEIVEFYNLAGDQLAFARPGSSSGLSRPSGPAVSARGNGSTHVEPNDPGPVDDGEQESTLSDQDISDLSSSGSVARDQVLAAFLEDPRP